MRVLIVNPHVGEGFGQERVLRDSVHLLRAAGHRVGILAEKLTGEAPEHDALWLIPGLSSIHWLTRPGHVAELHRTASAALTHFSPDVVHFYDQFDYRFMDWCRKRFLTVMTSHTVATTCPSSTRQIYPTGTCESKSGWRCLTQHHHNQCLSFLKTPVHRAHAIENHLRRQSVLKQMHGIGAISQYVRRTLLEDGFTPQKVQLLYNPITLPEPFTRVASPTPLLLSACRLNDHKGVSGFLEALKKIEALPWRAQICGDGPLGSALKKRTFDLGLNDRVVFRGRVAFAEVQELMKKATLFVQPNLGPEPFGLSVAEASAYGLPSVVSKVAALDEIVEEGTNGFLVEPGNSKALADKLSLLLRDETLRERLSQAGPQLIQKRFSPKHHLQETLKLYKAPSKEITLPLELTS